MAQAITRNASSHEIWIVLSAAFPETIPEIRQAFQGLVDRNRIRVFEAPFPIAESDPANSWRNRAAEAIRDDFIRRLQPDVVWISSLFEGYIDDAISSVSRGETFHTVVTHYDLIPLMAPQSYLRTANHRLFYHRKIASLRTASLLLAISDASRDEVINELGLPAASVMSISAAVSDNFRPMEWDVSGRARLREKYGIRRDMVLYVPGGFDPRKNFENLIKAYSLLDPGVRSAHQLVVVSKISKDARASLATLAGRAGLSQDEFVITGYVSDYELVQLYNLATLFVFPSRHEGFGLPALEAMACGTPTIGSNTSSIPEVIGWERALFDPEDPQDISVKMTEVLTDDTFRVMLRKHGLQQAGSFSWDKCARRALAAIESLPPLPRGVGSAESISNCRILIDSIARVESSIKPSLQDIRQVASVMAFNVGAEARRCLFLDISELSRRDAKSGIQRVVRSILSELVGRSVRSYEVCPIYFDGKQYRHAKRFISRFMNGVDDVALSDPAVDFHQDDIYLSLDLNVHLTPLVHDLHKYLHDVGLRMYFIVYDILLVQRPDWWPGDTGLMFKSWLRSLAQVATGLICISKSVAREVQDWLQSCDVKRSSGPTVTSFRLGADVENSMPSSGLPADAQDVIAQLASRPSFLAVGTVEPRKGYAQTLAAFELLWDRGEDVNLVIVGKEGWLVERLAAKLRSHSELNRRLFWLEGVSDEYLEKIYEASTSLIAASEGEGFGLPLIEAAQHGKPIIARDLAVFQEVAGDHAFYFHGLTSEDLADAVTSWLALWRLGAHPTSNGLRYLSWRESTLELLANIEIEADSAARADIQRSYDTSNPVRA